MGDDFGRIYKNQVGSKTWGKGSGPGSERTYTALPGAVTMAYPLAFTRNNFAFPIRRDFSSLPSAISTLM